MSLTCWSVPQLSGLCGWFLLLPAPANQYRRPLREAEMVVLGFEMVKEQKKREKFEEWQNLRRQCNHTSLLVLAEIISLTAPAGYQACIKFSVCSKYKFHFKHFKWHFSNVFISVSLVSEEKNDKGCYNRSINSKPTQQQSATLCITRVVYAVKL